VRTEEHPLDPFFSTIETVKRNWAWFLALGIFLIILGFLAIGSATFTTFFSIFFMGFLLLIGGIAKIVYSFWAREWSGFFLSMLIGIFYALVGFLFLAKPIPSAAALTLLMGSLFFVSGLFKIIGSVVVRFEQWGWVLTSGIISLILGILILSEWPLASLWIIGLFVGIDLIFYGWTWVILSLGARSALERPIKTRKNGRNKTLGQ
jgi:uncharacterized membrane protein HdeD (DUF308 family)